MIEHYNIRGFFVGIVTAVLFVAASSAWAQSTDQAGLTLASLDKDFQSEIKDAERVGRVIFLHDRAAAVATDLLVERVGPNLNGKVAGWIEEPTGGDDIRIVFFKLNGENYLPAYSIDVNRRGEAGDFHEYADSESLSAKQLSMVRARELVGRQSFAACSDSYNTVVTDDGKGGFYVYLLAASSTTDDLFFGGHYRFQTNADGTAITGFNKYTNSCLTLPRHPPERPGEQIAGLVVSQVVTPYPTEIHVWNSLLVDYHLYVVTIQNKAIWRVSRGNIQFLNLVDEKVSSEGEIDLASVVQPSMSSSENVELAGQCLSRLASERQEGACAPGAHSPTAALAVPGVASLRVGAQ